MDLIKEYGLDASSILGDTKLGLGANATSLTEAMARAMEAIVAQLDKRIGGALLPGTIPGATTNYGAMPNLLTKPRSFAFESSYSPQTTGRQAQMIDNRLVLEEGAIVIYAAPGMDVRQLAREIQPELDRIQRERRGR